MMMEEIDVVNVKEMIVSCDEKVVMFFDELLCIGGLRFIL